MKAAISYPDNCGAESYRSALKVLHPQAAVRGRCALAVLLGDTTFQLSRSRNSIAGHIPIIPAFVAQTSAKRERWLL